MAQKPLNLLRDELRMQAAIEPSIVVLFGASGDLARRKLIPAPFSLCKKQLLAPGFSVIGSARSEMSHDAYREAMRKAILEFEPEAFNEAEWKSFAGGLFYVSGATQDDKTFINLGSLLGRL